MSFEQEQKHSILDQIMADQVAKQSTSVDIEEFLRDLLGPLTDRERTILTRRFGLFATDETTLESLGKEYDVTRERVRQIERQALQRVNTAIKNDTRLDPVRASVTAVLDKHGGLMHHDHLLDEIAGLYFQIPSDAAEATARLGAARRAIRFVFEILLKEQVVATEPSAALLPGWRHPLTDENTHATAVKQVEDFFASHRNVIPFAEFVREHAPRVITAFAPGGHTADSLRALITVAQNLDQNVFGEVGLSSWPMIRPRRMGDKGYLVLRKVGEPLHFRAIADKINEFKFDRKQAFAETIHNELITDPRFILVGRGLYALREWGYIPGVVSDVIAAVLKERAEALPKDTIIREVLKQRLVKPETVYLALTNKKRFTRLPDGRYVIAS